MDELRGTEPGVVSLDWAVGKAMDTWNGITVGGTPPRVAGLVINNGQLTGSIPAALGDLTGLTRLDLSTNFFNDGRIPAALNQLTNLTYLSLHNCFGCPSSSIPYLGNLINLTELRLEGNAYTGTFPTWLGRLTKLTHFHLFGTAPKDPDGVGLTGSIPNLGNLTSLEELLIDNNSLTGGIPTWLGNLTSLTRLDLDRNQLTGRIPPALGRLTSLTHLDLSNNDLEGEIPDLSGLTALQDLFLHKNALTGRIPEELGRLTNLQRLWLQQNQLESPLPDLGTLTAMEDLDLSHNPLLTDTFPAWLGALSKLQYLYLRFTGLTGPIPPTLGDLTNLRELHLAATDWTGTIPPALLERQGDGDLNLWTNRQPVAPADAKREVTEGRPFRHAVPFTDPDGDTLICTATLADADKLPVWLRIDPECSLSGAARTVGEEIMVKVTATDEDTLPAGAIPCDPDRPEAADERNPPPLCASTTVTYTVREGDDTNPVLQRATVDGNTVIMTYNEPLLEDGCPDGETTPEGVVCPADGINNPPQGSQFRLREGMADPSDQEGYPTDVGVRGSTVTLRFDEIDTTNGVYLQYTPGIFPIRDEAGNEAAELVWTSLPYDNPEEPSAPPGPRPPGDGGPPSGGGGGPACAADRHGNTAAQATALALATETAGAICPAADVDYFTVTAPGRGLLFVETPGESPLRGTLWQGGAELATGPTGRQPDARLGALVDAGAVVVAVAGQGGATGDYEIVVTFSPGYLENPGHNSFQSGIGVISGWVCEADKVEIEIETERGETERYEAGYGTARLDTAVQPDGPPLCGDTDNGFGLLFNWNRLGAGEYAVVAWVDGVELGRAVVTVTTVGEGAEEEFLRGVEGECVVEDFPMLGETVRLEWQQNNQNFVITSGTRPAGANRAGIAGMGYLENPGPNSFQSGIGVISGWVCEAETVEIVFETAQGGVHRYEAAYGTERADTAVQRKDGTPLCGDTDNGFGLLFNWNRLGAGEHTVRALVDGAALGWATVRVTTVGEGAEEEFLREVAGECVVADFPTMGEMVTLEWQQSWQNFVITDVQ